MSLVKSPLIATPDSDTQDFSIVMLVKTLGSLVGAPLMTVLWVHAIKLGGAGLGLPYFVSAVSAFNKKGDCDCDSANCLFSSVHILDRCVCDSAVAILNDCLITIIASLILV